MKTKTENTKILKTKYVSTSEFYSQIIDSLQDYSIFTLDINFKINSWSSGAQNIFGYETDEVIGKHFNVIFTDTDKKNGVPKKELKEALDEGRANDIRWHLCKDGSTFYANGILFPLIDKDGKQTGYVKIVRDLTERKKVEDALKESMKRMEELNNHKDSILAILSHDLHTPLTGITGLTEYLKSHFHKMKQSDIKDMLELIHKSTIEEVAMLDYLVEWARIKYASQVFTPTNIDLAKSVDKVYETLHETAALKSIVLKNEVEENTSVFADEKMLHSILQNLVSNAIKNSKQNGHIIISSRIKNEKSIIRVMDTGNGMDKETVDNLFTPHLKNYSRIRKENEGSGLGLILVKGFIEKHGGQICAESIEGDGSSFYFSLPINNLLNFRKLH